MLLEKPEPEVNRTSEVHSVLRWSEALAAADGLVESRNTLGQEVERYGPQADSIISTLEGW